jgi:tetratricopeptide (TPR) repeat protein
VLDWYSNPDISGDKASTYIVQAEQAANRAIQLDNTNALAQAYFAEILNDEQKWTQAGDYAAQALKRDPSLMDVHRVNALVQETLGNYGNAINEYKKAAEITPNLTFLYLSIGGNYRILKQYPLALEYYAKAASINDSLGVKDPLPYIAIGKTYSQMGEFFIASVNMRKALQFNPESPDVYGQLGIVYFRSRNYESAIPALKCAVKGCTAQESCDVRRCDKTKDPVIVIQGMPLKSNTVVYYYTYGSVLAGMHRPTNDTCTEAVQILGLVRDGFGGDPVIINIIKPSEDICASYHITR